MSHWRSLRSWVTVPGSLESFCVQNLAACLSILSKVLINYVLGSVDHMILTHIQVLVGQGLCRLST